MKYWSKSFNKWLDAAVTKVNTGLNGELLTYDTTIKPGVHPTLVRDKSTPVDAAGPSMPNAANNEARSERSAAEVMRLSLLREAGFSGAFRSNKRHMGNFGGCKNVLSKRGSCGDCNVWSPLCVWGVSGGSRFVFI